MRLWFRRWQEPELLRSPQEPRLLHNLRRSTQVASKVFLLEAAEKVIVKLSPQSKLAIVYVTASDPDIAEFIANELGYIMVEQGLTLIYRSQLDRIRNEQNFQLSGEVDDAHVVSIGKIVSVNVILTGAVTGMGDIRRLRLRYPDTQSAQVLAATSECY